MWPKHRTRVQVNEQAPAFPVPSARPAHRCQIAGRNSTMLTGLAVGVRITSRSRIRQERGRIFDGPFLPGKLGRFTTGFAPRRNSRCVPDRACGRGRKKVEHVLIDGTTCPRRRDRLTVLVGNRVERRHDEEATAFREATAALPQVVACQLDLRRIGFPAARRDTGSCGLQAAAARHALDVAGRQGHPQQLRPDHQGPGDVAPRSPGGGRWPELILTAWTAGRGRAAGDHP